MSQDAMLLPHPKRIVRIVEHGIALIASLMRLRGRQTEKKKTHEHQSVLNKKYHTTNIETNK